MLSSISYFAHDQGGKFPMNTVFSLETFGIYQGVADFVSGFVEYPLALVQAYILNYSDLSQCSQAETTQCLATLVKFKLQSIVLDIET